MYSLSSLLHRNVSVDEVGNITSVEKTADELMTRSKSVDKSDLVLDSSKRFAENQELDRDLKARQMLPDLNISLGYQTNDYDPNSSNVFEKGNSLVREIQFQ